MIMRAPVSELPIELEAATVTAGGMTILDNISLTLSSGAPTVLIGPNGSGKTTLLRVIMGLLPLDSGRILWGGHSKAAPDRRAIVFQRPTMLRRSVSGNLRYALNAADQLDSDSENRIDELLALVGLDGYEHRPARRLSGGEQQRLAIARALARDPALMLLDEPTASLDPAATKAIEDVVRAVSARGVKVVMATHDLGQARRIAGDIIVLHRGRVIEAGPAQRVLEAPASSEARQFIAGELLI